MTTLETPENNLAATHNLAVLAEGQIPTKNKRGMQMATLSPLFAQWIASADGTHPLADIGCAYGINTLAALKQGFAVVGIDLGEEHFPLVHDLYAEAKSKATTSLGELTLIAANVLEPLPIADNSLSGILFAEVLHFMPGDAALGVLRQFFNKLRPGGTLCLHCAHVEGMQSMPSGTSFIAEIERQRALGLPWPGEMKDFYSHMEDELNGLDFPDYAKPDFFHVFSLDQVRDLVTAAGFEIVSLSPGEHRGYPAFLRTPTSNLQLIARRA